MSLLVHDTIKINYVREGYLPNYPYHLLGDSEMMKAFLTRSDDIVTLLDADEVTVSYVKSNYAGYMMDKYVNPLFKQFNSTTDLSDNETIVLQAVYDLLNYILDYEFQPVYDAIDAGTYDPEEELPIDSWVYSYMLGAVIGQKSDQLDKHDLLVLLDDDNIDDDFTVSASMDCLVVSRQWLKKKQYTVDNPRPAAPFGELHVMKSLRLDDVF